MRTRRSSLIAAVSLVALIVATAVVNAPSGFNTSAKTPL